MTTTHDDDDDPMISDEEDKLVTKLAAMEHEMGKVIREAMEEATETVSLCKLWLRHAEMSYTTADAIALARLVLDRKEVILAENNASFLATVDHSLKRRAKAGTK